jgi:hypothetical protein
MDRYLIKTQSTTQLLNDEPLTTSAPIILGVLGHSNAQQWTLQTIADDLCSPLLGELGRIPEALVVPSDGTTSLLLQAWAERQKIAVTPLDADWVRLGRRARALRDARILKECSHLLIFLGKRSDTYEKLAIREAKKGKIVFTVDPETFEIVQWQV